MCAHIRVKYSSTINTITLIEALDISDLHTLKGVLLGVLLLAASNNQEVSKS